jgi:kynureninase
MPKSVRRKLEQVLTAGWRDSRSRGWFQQHWLDLPFELGRRLAPLIGAGADDVIFCDNTSINLFKMLAAALALRSERRFILTESANFGTDLYIAEALCERSGGRHAMRYAADAVDLSAMIDSETAVVYLSLVDYRDSRRHDLAAITRAAHAQGALVVWDLSHAAGAVAIDLLTADVDFAVGCGYKYLCGGPGAPAFLFVHPRWQQDAVSIIPGWMGHADMLAFEPTYRPAAGIRRFLTGTSPVLANTIALAALEIWAEIEPAALFAKHRGLSELLVQLIDRELAPFGAKLASPRDYDQRGGHIALAVNNAETVLDQLLQRGVQCSLRKPQLIRFGLAPLGLRYVDVWDGIATIKDILQHPH